MKACKNEDISIGISRMTLYFTRLQKIIFLNNFYNIWLNPLVRDLNIRIFYDHVCKQTVTWKTKYGT